MLVTRFCLLLGLGLCLAGCTTSSDTTATPSWSTTMPATQTEITLYNPSVNPGIRSYTVRCAYQKCPNELEVLLPDDYSQRKQYPVIYLLPVNVGTTGPWGSSIVEAHGDDVSSNARATGGNCRGPALNL